VWPNIVALLSVPAERPPVTQDHTGTYIMAVNQTAFLLEHHGSLHGY